MAYTLPDGFPHKLSDEALDEALDGLLASLREQYGDQVGKWLPELQLAFVSVAVSEQARRQLVRGGQLAWISLAVGAGALVVALLTLIATR